jgi:Fe2+ transport system protein FeoA
VIWGVPSPGRSEGGDARPLSKLRPGQSGIIVRVDSTSTERLVKLSSLGVMPGVRVELVQRHPATVLRIAETTIAIDGEVADEILVEPGEPPTGP